MGSARIIILVVAAVAALALMLIVGRLISHKPAQGPPPAPVAAVQTTNVVVAAHDLKIGTRLAASDLTTQPWPVTAVNAAYITDGRQSAPPLKGPAGVANQTSQAATAAVDAVTGAHGPIDALVGAIVKTPILANEPVTNAKLVRGGEGGFMAVVLHPGMRAVAVPVSVNTAAGGFILPGDRVDVIQARQADAANGGQRPYVVQTILQNVRVLAIDQASTPPKNGGETAVGAVATLEVTPPDAERVALAKVQGDMVLTLRSYADADGPSGHSGAPVQIGSVRIIRNGQLSETTVTP
ncbi:MAG: Flp pilus assembly protein CpaB [Caulobacteraceae bacterium]|nr:Flp pilus assembly protein CpaB [Caulobacteraceae bacterium]